MNVMTVDGFHATIEFDSDLDLFRGEILGLNGGADFYGKNPKELRTESNVHFKSFSKYVPRRELNPDAIFRASSICEFLPICTRSWLSLRRPRGRASTRWHRRRYGSALRHEDAS